MPKHVVRLLVLLAAFAVIAIAAKIYFVPRSYWVYGDYRAKSVSEIASDAPMYRGSKYCQSCHHREFSEWSTGVHRIMRMDGRRVGVICEDCHGPAGRHPLVGKPPLVAKDTHERLMDARYNLVTGKMRVPKNSLALCPQCHQKIAGRPAMMPQVVMSVHAGKQQCIACHNPHTPGIVFPAVAKEMLAGLPATGKAASTQCAACHGASGTSISPAFPNLAGQHRAYLVAALEDYKTGKRKSAIMNAVAKPLKKRDISNLAAYFASLPRQTPTTPEVTASTDARKAQEEACQNCHGGNGVSQFASVPDLAGQKEAYLANALNAYHTGARRESLMSRVAHYLTTTDIKELAAYYAHLSAAAKTPLPRHAEVRPNER